MHDIFAFGDIHGMYDLYKAIMDYCYEQDPEATIVFLGDACDRGRNGYKIIKELLDNPYVIYLKGNHEDMLTHAMREIKQYFNLEDSNRDNARKILRACRYFDSKYMGIQSVMYNGGTDTLLDWIEDGMPIDIYNKLIKLPLTFSTDVCDFCHSAGTFNTFSTVAMKEYREEEIHEWESESILWERVTLESKWRDDRIAIFGHTPVMLVPEFVKSIKFEKIQPLKWDNKIDMDTGAAFTGKAYVLNCLTMQAQGFEDKEFKDDEFRKHDVEKIDVIQM